MNLRLLTIALASLASFSISNAVLEWPTVDTRNNKIGLDVKFCKFNPESARIVCITSEGEEITIDDVEVRSGSSEGTPPWLQFTTNYIGQTIGEDAHGIPGAGKRTIYLKR